MPTLDVTLIIAVPIICYMQMIKIICVIAPSPRGLQSLLDICSKYGFENDILYNPAKSSCLVVKPSRFQLKCPDVYINNKLDYVGKVKYLGGFICDDMKDDEDMLRHLRSFYARSNSILRKFHNCSVDVKLYLFHAYCCTIYCSQLWVNFKTFRVLMQNLK